MKVSNVLVAIERPDGRVAVVEDVEGDLFVAGQMEGHEMAAHALRGFASRVEDGRPARIGCSLGWALGGRLPEGAAAVEVIDDNGQGVAGMVADGAWLAVLDREFGAGNDAPVVYRDANGTPVRPPLPAHWPRLPVTDSDVPCPGCAAIDWEQVTPIDDPYYEGQPLAQVVCRVCGHEEPVIVSPPGLRNRRASPTRRETEAIRERRRERNLAVLNAVDFPVYAAEGRNGQLASGITKSGERVTEVSVDHGTDDLGRSAGLRITTESGSPEFEIPPPGEWEPRLARHALLESLARCPGRRLADDGTPLSDAALALTASARRRRALRLALRTPVVDLTIPVDGEPVDFSFAEADSHWAAVGSVDDLLITIFGDDSEDVGDLRLTAVPDPAATLI